MDQRLYQLYLAELAYRMPKTVRMLLREFGTAERIWELKEQEIRRIGWMKPEQQEELAAMRKRGLPEWKLEEMEQKEIGAVCIEDGGYPSRLRQLTDPPYMLFYKGRLPEETRSAVAVIGARRCSDYGRRAADYFGRELARSGIPVISGLAVGIDGLSQSACLEEGGISYGVLGSGVDVVYPAGNRTLYGLLPEKGGILSEYLPGTVAAAWHFPQRNRIISGLADLVLVVEAREKSGTFITVEYALAQGKEVYAVPGRVGDNLSLGCNRMIRDGAGIATCAEDLVFALQDLGNRSGERKDRSGLRQSREAAAPEGLEQSGSWVGERRQAIRRRLLEAAASAEELYALPELGEGSIQELLTELMLLEIEGTVACRGGRYEIRP